MNVKFKLEVSYCWMVVSSDGLLKDPKDKWGEYHTLSQRYSTREDAISDYSRHIEESISCPTRMILVEEYSQEIDW